MSRVSGLCCYHVGNNIGSWAIGEVMVVIEMVVDEKDDREVYKVRKVVRSQAAEQRKDGHWTS